jgi:hypothetical protein
MLVTNTVSFRIIADKTLQKYKNTVLNLKEKNSRLVKFNSFYYAYKAGVF